MGRSRGFGSAAGHRKRAIRTRFRSGYTPEGLNLRPTATRRFILQKARHHPDYR